LPCRRFYPGPEPCHEQGSWSHTQGLKASQLKKLSQSLNRRRLPPDRLVLPEQATDLARLSAELGRQVGVGAQPPGRGGCRCWLAGQARVPARAGHEAACAGAATRLAGPCAFAHQLQPGLLGLGPGRSEALARQRLGPHRGSMGVLPGRRARTCCRRRYLRPEHQTRTAADERLIEPHPPGHPPEDLARLVRVPGGRAGPRRRSALEIGGGEPSPPAQRGPTPTGARLEARKNELDELAQMARSAGLSVVGRVVQRRSKPAQPPHYIWAAGKLREVLLLARAADGRRCAGVRSGALPRPGPPLWRMSTER
jgi:GTP-binding protein HflX